MRVQAACYYSIRTGKQSRKSRYSEDSILRYKGGTKVMKGYNTAAGFMGYVNGQYVLFASENEYFEYLEESDE